MTKNEFLKELEIRLQGLPSDDLKERLSFYEEAICDRMDEGKTEEEAVNEMGTIDEIVSEVASETPLLKLVKEKIKPKRKIKAWEIVLIVLGFPLWFPLILTALVLAFVFYLLIWIMVIVLGALEISFASAAVGSLIAFILALGMQQPALVYLGSFLFSVGAAILLVFALIGVTKATIKLSKRIINAIKRAFIKKGDK